MDVGVPARSLELLLESGRYYTSVAGTLHDRVTFKVGAFGLEILHDQVCSIPLRHNV